MANTCEVEKKIRLFKGADYSFTLVLKKNGALFDLGEGAAIAPTEIKVLLAADAGGAVEHVLAPAAGQGTTSVLSELGGKIKVVGTETESALLKKVESGDIEVETKTGTAGVNTTIFQKEDVVIVKKRLFT